MKRNIGKTPNKKLMLLIFVTLAAGVVAIFAYNKASYEPKPTGGCNYYAGDLEISASEAAKAPRLTRTVCS